MNKKITRVCIVDSAYTLLLYFLISNESEIQSTFYFWSKGIPSQVKEKFPEQSYDFDVKFKNRLHLLFFYFKLYNYSAENKWPFLKDKSITYWGHDHLPFSGGILRNNKLNVIEDGLSNYYPRKYSSPNPRFQWIKRILFGQLYSQTVIIGDGDYCSNIYLTGLKETGVMNLSKTIQISSAQLWNESTIAKQKLINNIFELTQEEINLLSMKKYILLTQTFSEDYLISENEKIQIYKDIIMNIDSNQLVIKPHPREKTDYYQYFTNITILQKKIPMQLLLLNKIFFSKVFTVCSTAAFDFPNETEINIIGSQVHPNILKVFPELSK